MQSIWWIWCTVQRTLAMVGMPRLAVDVGAARVVDAREDDRDPVGLLGRAGADDVAVVARGDGDERVGVFDPGCLQHRTAVPVALVEAARGTGRAAACGSWAGGR